MSGEIRRLFNKNDVLKVTVIKLLKSKQDHKGSVYQSDIESCYLKRYYYYIYIYIQYPMVARGSSGQGKTLSVFVLYLWGNPYLYGY